MLVEGIRPVLPLIRNTPYGKRIQNKLQRDQIDGFGGGFHNQQALMNIGLGSQNLGLGGGRGLSQSHSLAEVYSSQGNLYSLQNGQNSVHSQPLHGLQSPIDGYVLQSNSPHNHGLTPTHSHGGGFSNTFSSVNSFPAVGLTGSLNDRYTRSAYYGM
jgi:hypothetical protein